MNNSRQISIIEKMAVADEFEDVKAPVNQNANFVQTEEERAFNSKISNNFDRIMHYDVFTKEQEKADIEARYARFTGGYAPKTSVAVDPSATTMQFKGVSREEINQDLKEDVLSYQTETKSSKKSKVLAIVLSCSVAILSGLIILNTILLKNMNSLVKAKTAELQELTAKEQELQETLNEVSSDESIIEKAKELGMTEIEK